MLTILWNKKSEALGMRLQPPSYQIHPLRHAVTVSSRKYNFSFLLQAVQQLQELPELLRVRNMEMTFKLLIGHRFISGLPHKIKQL
ncbi:hypothetical protein D3C77_686880 [compost metagenome]